jgi:hypothetical protein
LHHTGGSPDFGRREWSRVAEDGIELFQGKEFID